MSMTNAGLTAVLFQTHVLSRTVLRQFRKLQRQSPPRHHAVLLLHAPAGTPKPAALEAVPHHFVTTPELRALGYSGKRGEDGRAWNPAATGDTDLPLLHFRAARRGAFERFWVVEYDVRYSGHWATFFGAFAANDADLLAAAVRRRDADLDWTLWGTLREPRKRAACDTAGGEIACFMPVFRASDRAVAEMDAAYAEGWAGHCEVAWPTLLHRRRLRIEDIGGGGEFVAAANLGRFYSNTPTAWNLSPGTLVFRPPRLVAGLRRDVLWHPVKSFGEVAADRLGRLRHRLRQIGRAAALVHRSGPAPSSGPRHRITGRAAPEAPTSQGLTLNSDPVCEVMGRGVACDWDGRGGGASDGSRPG